MAYSLNFKKGVNAISRALRLLDSTLNLAVYSVIFKRLECIEIFNSPLGTDSDKIEKFMELIIPPFNAILLESTMSIVSSLSQILCERHNLIWLAKSKAGLVILTMLLSRAETLKQSTDLGEQDLSMW